ncbi:MAG: Hsp20/alpha crystallin family protein [Planctomycetales bacterium]
MAGTLTKRMSGLLPAVERGPISALRHEMDDLVGRFFGEDKEQFFGGGLPDLDISETDSAVEVKMDLPGVKPEEVDIDLSGDVLTVSGERKEEKESKENGGRKFHRVERRYGSFSRSVWLPCAVQEGKVDARYHDGVLTITLPKSEASKSKKIKVKA